MDKIYTIGYEGLTPHAFAAALKEADIRMLIDVRAVPLSRKPGFSKNVLAASLRENGIAYAGLRGLGTPARGRDAARKGRMAEFRAIFAGHLESPAAIEDMTQAIRLAREGKACLLCFEHDPHHCHRMMVAQHIGGVTGMQVEHLGQPRPAPL